MDTDTFLEVISIMRHDFLNQLQVVLGLAQLNKTDRIRDYMDRIIDDTKSLGVLSEIEAPEVRAALTAGFYLSYSRQIKVVYNIAANFSQCVVPGEIAGRLLLELFRTLLALDWYCVDEKILKMFFTESDKEYQVKIAIPGQLAESAENAVVILSEYVAAQDQQAGMMAISFFPARAEVLISIRKS